jgi:hypothetical protein
MRPLQHGHAPWERDMYMSVTRRKSNGSAVSVVGLYKMNPVETHSLKAPGSGFNP